MRQGSGDHGPRAGRLLVISAVLISGAWLLSPIALPPVYDGLPEPANHYRYVDPPPGVPNPGAPLSAHVEVQLVGGGNPPVDLPTGEYPPQAEVQLSHGDVEGNIPGVPAVATAQVTITPVQPPTVAPPAGEQFHGNVYLLRVVAAGHSLTLRPGAHATVSLRQPRQSFAHPQVAVLESGRWTLLETHGGTGPGVLVAALPALGDVVILEGTSGFVPSHTRSDVIAALALCGLAVAALILVRLSRTRRRKDSASV